MEDNKNMNTQKEDLELQEPKTFTQEEVDEIVKKRLARERRKADPGESAEMDSDREKDLDARELRIMAKERLQDAGMPVELADVLRYSDEESLEKAMETIKTLNQGAYAPRKGWGERHSRGGVSAARDPIREAMGLGQK